MHKGFDRQSSRQGLKVADFEQIDAPQRQPILYEDLLKALSEMGEGVAIMAGTRFLFANDALARIYGYTVDELLALPSTLDLVVPEQRGELSDRLRRRASGDGTVKNHGEATILRKDGARINIEYGLKELEARDSTRLVVIVRDITERKNAESSLKVYAVVVNNMAEGLCLVRASDETIVYANPKFERMLFFERGELDGKHVSIVNYEGEIAFGAHPAEVLGRELRAQGEAVGEVRARTKHGQPLWCRVSTSRLDHPQHGLVWVTTYEEISARKMAEELVQRTQQELEQRVEERIDDLSKANAALEHQIGQRERAEKAATASEAQSRLQQTRFRALIEKSSDLISLLAADGTTLYMSPAVERVLGYDASHFVGKGGFDFAYPDDRELVYRAMGRLLEEPSQSINIVFRAEHRDGTTRWLEATGTNMLADLAVRGIVGNFRDITERKRAEEALRRTEEQLGQVQKMDAIGGLAGGVAHDFNNLLSVILGYTSMIAAGLSPGDPMRADLEEVKGAAERATDLTRQLLAFSRRQILQPRIVNLNEIVTGMERMLGRLIGEDVELLVVRAPRLGKVKVDPGQMEQVIMNLAVNARDAMPRGGKLIIETTNVELDETYAAEHVGVTPGPHVMFSVSDSGSGMTEATQARMFEPFFTTKEKGKGTGLGLSTVFGIVKQSGGSIFPSSEVGRGTTFRVYFPRAEESAPVEWRPSQAPLTGMLIGSETILLVEDDERVRSLASTILRRSGYDVLVAQSGGDGLLICEQHTAPIELLLTDVVMPRMSGRQLADRLRSVRPAMRVLFMSGYADDSVIHHGALDSGIAFLQKPITPETLTRKVREVLDSPLCPGT